MRPHSAIRLGCGLPHCISERLAYFNPNRLATAYMPPSCGKTTLARIDLAYRSFCRLFDTRCCSTGLIFFGGARRLVDEKGTHEVEVSAKNDKFQLAS